MRTSSQRQASEKTAGAGTSGRGSQRGLITTVGIAVLLIAAIALANRGWNSGGSAAAAADDPLAPEIPHSRQGAQSTAVKFAGRLGSESMFNTADRHGVVQAIADPDERDALQTAFDGSYTVAFNERIGLDEEGKAPAGATFVNRTMPVGTVLKRYSTAEATVDVWCSGLFGITGRNVTQIPVTTSWFTMTMTLRWTDDGWKMTESTQEDGPEPTSSAAEFGQAPQL
ncbi:hypothetical protein ACIPC1_39600 [Streptomyces sp. NPDC087263]|uniref:hypothetical protein n=1 Tax=Streptomyces sp. NPDC087263 TaxID=3365773 RepID=UPI00382AFCC4